MPLFVYALVGFCIGYAIGFIIIRQFFTWLDERRLPPYQRTGWRYKPYIKGCECKEFPCPHSPGQKK